MKSLLQFKTFFEQNKLRIVIISITAMFVLLLTLDVVNKNLQPKKTEGYSPEQVVELFYQSINALDFETMDDCITSGAGKDKINEVVRLSVTSRQAKALGQKSSLVTVREWENMNKVQLESPQVLYGITDMQIIQEKDTIFNVTYIKWEFYHDDKEILQNKNFEVKEKVFLKKRKNNWAIYKIENTQ